MLIIIDGNASVDGYRMGEDGKKASVACSIARVINKFANFILFFRFIFVFHSPKSHVETIQLDDIEFGSEAFEEFLTVLGEKIRLKGWERFRGGLDVKGKW